MTFIDSDKLKAFLKEGKTHVKGWTGSASASSLATIEIIETYIDSGNLDAVDTRTPVDKISTPVTNRVRSKGESTSFEAAVSISPVKAQRTYYNLMLAYRTRGPQTDDEMASVFSSWGMQFSPSGLRARRSELRDKGWVRDSGKKRPSNSGHPSIVWEMVP